MYELALAGIHGQLRTGFGGRCGRAVGRGGGGWRKSSASPRRWRRWVSWPGGIAHDFIQQPGASLGQLTHEHGGHFLAYLDDGRTLLAAGIQSTVALIDVQDLRVRTVLESAAGELTRVALSRDRRRGGLHGPLRRFPFRMLDLRRFTPLSVAQLLQEVADEQRREKRRWCPRGAGPGRRGRRS